MLGYSENRVAFVLGNGAYRGDVRLDNPVRDAAAVRRALERLSFQVFSGTDLDFEATEETFAAFEARLAGLGRADVALIYYSGHGLQDHETNYLVPIGAEDADGERAGKLVVLQDLINRITPYSRRRLVILDACRSNPAAKKIATELQKTKGYVIDGEVVTVDGLAGFEAATNTFLAFAAAPGKVAYDGGEDFSPFTGALLKHIEGVDLPLTNLTTRVRLEVLAATGERQQTWDHSSLTEQFFFNPGSLLLLIGNAIGLAALIWALLPYSLLLHEHAGTGWFSAGAAILAVVLALFLAGLHKAYARLRGERNADDSGEGDPRERLAHDARKGIAGGVFGGIIAAFFVTINYRESWPPDWFEPMPPFGEMLTENTVAAIFVAATLGPLSLIGADWLAARRLRVPGTGVEFTPWQMRVAGAVLGGIAAGMITAPLVTWYFGRFDRPFLEPWVMAPGAIAGTAIIAFAIVNYSLEKFSLRRLGMSALSAVGATIAAFAAAAILLGVLYGIGFIGYMVAMITSVYEEMLEAAVDYAFLSLLAGGLIYGMVIGPILGLLIGLTLVWTPESSAREPGG